MGIQASGKSTYYKQHFFRTHIRINLDMLRTRHREKLLIEACLAAKQPFVVDNTNPTLEDRARYIEICKSANFQVIGYFFELDFLGSVERNKHRDQIEQIPLIGIKSVAKKFIIPTIEEGFDQIYQVSIQEGNFVTREIER